MQSAPTIDREGRERLDEWTEVAFDARVVTVEATNAVYDDPDRAATFERVAADGVSVSPRATFTTGLSFSPPPPGDTTTDRLLRIAAEHAGREFQTSLAQDGLRNVERTGSRRFRVPGARPARAFRYDADYPLAQESANRDRLPVRVWAAIWPTEDAYAMAGGVYPLRDLDAAHDAADLTADPDADRSEVFACVRDAAR